MARCIGVEKHEFDKEDDGKVKLGRIVLSCGAQRSYTICCDVKIEQPVSQVSLLEDRDVKND